MSTVNAKKDSLKIKFVQCVYFIAEDKHKMKHTDCTKLLNTVKARIKNIIRGTPIKYFTRIVINPILKLVNIILI